MANIAHTKGREPIINEAYRLQMSPSRWEANGWKYEYVGTDEVFHNHPNKRNFQGHSQHMTDNPNTVRNIKSFKTSYGKTYKDRKYRQVHPPEHLSMGNILQRVHVRNNSFQDKIRFGEDYRGHFHSLENRKMIADANSGVMTPTMKTEKFNLTFEGAI